MPGISSDNGLNVANTNTHVPLFLRNHVTTVVKTQKLMQIFQILLTTLKLFFDIPIINIPTAAYPEYRGILKSLQ